MNRYKAARLALVGTSFFTEGGDWRSIYLYARSAETRGERVFLVNPAGKRGWRQLLAVWAFAPRVIVNALASFDSWLVLAMCLCRSDVRVYLHETEYALDSFGRAFPLRYHLLSVVLARNPLLCVSKKAEILYRERFGAKRTHVVYECVGNQNAVELDQGLVHIVNVGSLNERKGVELFSKVADLAKSKYPEWQFHWVGGLATTSQLYQSSAVQWHGFTWRPEKLVARCQLFFLSSIDDPCPLSAIEALQVGIPVVAYAKTGTAELGEGLTGCGVYHHYSAESAFAALELAVETAKAGVSFAAEPNLQMVSEKSFARSIERAVGLAGSSE